ncbi:hypothetical protein [Paenibacillus bovis]|uniref:DUF4303 domain-containing protein n=1 Tax=Paenibacillus bovis TaxID=1616788 RepID=A0A172ZHJ2_9BACL|nr:hypothetical protein [Paenibacillus bovis]ANF96757.1 hypothetical protein AR543_12540 [Paenibacillus bovis]
MSVYQVQIGRLLAGLRQPEGQGQYYVSAPEGLFTTDHLEGIQGTYWSMQAVEDLLYQACKEIIGSFAQSDSNQQVYTCIIEADNVNGNYLMYLNTINDLEQTTAYYDQYYQEKYAENHNESYNRSAEQIRQSIKYATGDYPEMIDDFGEALEKPLHLYREINERLWEEDEEGSLPVLDAAVREQIMQADADSIQIMDQSIHDSGLTMIALNVMARLHTETVFEQLDRTADFIAYVQSPDGEGGDYLTFSTLIRKTVSLEQLYLAMPQEQESDEQFDALFQQYAVQPVEEQFQYWTEQIRRNRWNTDKSVISKYGKTDFHAYAALLAAGSAIRPLIQQALDTVTDQDEDLAQMYRMLLQDLA